MDQTTVDPSQSLFAQMAANAAGAVNSIVSAWGASTAASFGPQPIQQQIPPTVQSTGISLGGLSTSGLVVGVLVILAVIAVKKAKG